MMSTTEVIVTVSAAVGTISITGSAFYLGGRMKTLVETLTDMVKDHEKRIRRIELN